jgi:hypothetical protein
MEETVELFDDEPIKARIKHTRKLGFKWALVLVFIGIWSWVVGWAWYDAFNSVYEYLVPIEKRRLPPYTFAWAIVVTGPFVVATWLTGFVPF